MDKIKAISLFCGCGGADLGLVGGFTYLGKKYSSTGVEVFHASDINLKAVETYNLNFKHKAVVADVNGLSFKKGSADIVMGGFPCQSFSTVNPTKRPDDIKTQLFWQMARVIEQVQPKVMIAENVKGFFSLEGGKYFNLAKKEFERIGYSISYKVVSAADFGVPQRRERLLMVGIKKSLRKNFEFPQQTHGEGGKLKRRAVLKDVIDELAIENQRYYFSKRAVEGVKRAKPNMKRALAQDLNSQCLTVTSHLAKVSLNSRDPVLLVDPAKELYRRFTTREAARIQSFPDSFQFAGSEADAYRQIGNAVPPVLMWNHAHAIMRQVFA